MKTFLPFLLFAVGSVHADPPSDLTSAWKLAAAFRFNESRDAFLHGTGDATMRKFGEAATLLNVQPRTGTNIQRAKTLFEEVVKEEPPSSKLNRLARFYIARVKEFYLSPQDIEGASQDYQLLLEEKTGDQLIEQAASRLVVMAAFSDMTPEERLEKLAVLERLASLLQTTAGRRQFHTSMAYALLDNGGDKSRAVDHFLLADREGYTRKGTAVSAWLVAAATAAEIGRKEDAKSLYQKMLATYPRDPRAFTVRSILADLDAPAD